MPRFLVPFAAALVPGLAACGDSPSTEQCEELLAHVVEIEARSATDESSSGARAEAIAQQKAEIEDYLGEEFVATCRDEYSRERVVCALDAESYEALVDCNDL